MHKACCALFLLASLLHGTEPPPLYRVRVSLTHHRGPFIATIQSAADTQVWVKSVDWPNPAVLDNLPRGTFFLRVVLSGGGVIAKTITISDETGNRQREVALKLDAREAVPDVTGTNPAHVVEWRQLAVPDAIHEQHQLAWDAMNRGDFQKAADVLRGVVAVWPSYHDGWLMLGIVLRTLQESDEAEVALRKAIDLNAESYYALVNLALILGHEDRDAEAIVYARQAYELNRNSLVANLIMGQLTFSLRRYEECIPYLELAVKLDPANFANPQLTLVVAYREIGELEQAIDHAEAWLRLHPDDEGRQAVEMEIRRLQRHLDDRCAGPSCS